MQDNNNMKKVWSVLIRLVDAGFPNYAEAVWTGVELPGPLGRCREGGYEFGFL
jgi:hypothetical protein